ncbi:2,3-bisphosphoglycerate-dependent phosphoglycerate mutase [Streptomyces sp. TRM72054]|uniref:2,3-bisphosphoglycerate-dependent phosphoglycerate mutase n=1 Tax=Streptomyces sp. TRM72054 TaxID=2870562 RepID=UPI001C8CB254|nr:2,3-bisphosphoglycerate-dependent phosphoglycerate mutase [Streptomyces sp. TRM72054]MBX9399230.1 2,3-bisphosphoglycerate-dependent phosphoglycerate mutase [Streptomyces sp. TRM72054]
MTVPGTLVLLRHGQSTTNAAGRFTGWLDVPLTTDGERQAAAAGALLARRGLLPDIVHTSVMARSIRSADLLLDTLDRSWIPVHRTWRLNERQYGALTGRCKKEVRAEAGQALYHHWRRSLHGKPAPLPAQQLTRLRADPRYTALRPHALPAVENLADMTARVTPYWADVLAPQLLTGATVLVVAHGNSVRALATVLDQLSEDEVRRLNIPTGQPLRHDFDHAMRPRVRGGTYLNPDTALAQAELVAAEGHT